MKRKYDLKRCAALILSGALTLGAIPLPGLVQEAHAAADAAQPSAVAYATLDQLKAVTPPLVTGYTDYDGDVSLVGRLKLGRNSEDEVMEWYILGSDPGVDGDNVAVFATSNMLEATDETKYDGTTGQQFDPESDDSTKKWSGGGEYDTSTLTEGTSMVAGETEVYLNHYGVSLLRKNTAELVTKKFTAAEQERLQATTVTTQDYKNGSPALYTTTDTLYAAWGDPKYYETGSYSEEQLNIYIGSGKDTAGKKITCQGDSYGTYFWLRSPYATQPTIALCGDTWVGDSWVKYNHSVRPATNFKLDNVLFASAASAATTSGTAASIKTKFYSKDAMMLRLDGKDQKIGTASFSNGTITAKKGETTGDVTLIVQGKNGSTDWYYAKTIDSTETVTTDTIATALGAGMTASDISLSDCEIWLETPVEPTVDADKQTLFYAVEAEEVTHEHTYPTSDATSPDYWNGRDGEYHWRWCTDEECPSRESSITEEGRIKHPETGKLTTGDKDPDHHWKVCPVCGEMITDTIDDHDPSDWKVDDTDTSKHIGTCECGYTETGSHDFSAHESDATHHWNKCSKCGYSDETSRKEHTFGDDGKCTDPDCNYDGEHDFYEVAQTEPTCIQDGEMAHWECSVSGHGDEIFTGAVGAYVLSDQESIVIGKLGHHAGSEYSKVDDTYCAPVCDRENDGDVCGYVITDQKEKHDFEDGICTRCGYDKSSGVHKHTYDDTVWEDNATYHWHQCTDAQCPDVKGSITDKARHTFDDGKCSVCGRTKSSHDSSDDSSDDGGSSSYTSDSGSSGSSGTWRKDDTGRRYEYANGTYAKGSLKTNEDGTSTLYVGWAKVGSSWFAFDADGYMMQDWVYDAASSYWYYCDAGSGMKRGWLYTAVDDCWYYLDPGNGEMHTGWSTIDGKRYYFSEMHNGTYHQDPATGKWIYANPADLRPLGSMYESTITPDGSLVGEDGEYIAQ